MTPPALTVPLPPVAPDVVAASVESLTSRLRKKLDAAIESYAALPTTAVDGTVRIACGEDATVTLTPGPSGAVTEAGQVRCTCLLDPRCLHRAAALGACPVADADAAPTAAASEHDPTTMDGDTAPLSASASNPSASTSATSVEHGAQPAEPTSTGPTAAQASAAACLWAAAAAVLAAGVPAAGAVPQAELLRAAHTARLAGLYRAEAAALRVVRGLRSARARNDGHRVADLVAALGELLLIAGNVAASDPDPGLIGTARRGYEAGGSLRVHGVCREPVISATGYGGVVTHLVTEDGRWYCVADVKPGGPARARGAATAPVALGSVALDHAQLARGGLLIVGATISPDGRLGSGRGVRATPLAGRPWSSGPLADRFARPLAEAVAERFAVGPAAETERTAQISELVSCELLIVGAAGDQLLARELRPSGASPTPAEGPLIRLSAANNHPDLAHTANFRQLASRPGLRLRVVGRLDLDRAATFRPLAVGPVPDHEATLRLPAQWQEHADLGYDRLQGSHLPPREACSIEEPTTQAGLDPLVDSPLWRVRRLVELAVSGGRRVVGEFARTGDSLGGSGFAQLRRAGFRAAADLSAALTVEADRRTRDVFGRLGDADADRYAWAWLAAATHLAGTERALVQATWSAE